MIIKEVSLDIVCGVTSKIPKTDMPEIAFAGRSNVGKSSLINVMMNRKSLARTSSKPGKTQTINYYNINHTFYLVDLPGYGYTSAGVKAREAWGRMIENYLHVSKGLKAVFLLVDIRHAPSKDDQMMYHWILESGYSPIVIATKQDKIKRSQLQKQLKLVRDTLEMTEETVLIPFSAVTKSGRDEIYGQIERVLELEPA